jgi:hypothetical protein
MFGIVTEERIVDLFRQLNLKILEFEKGVHDKIIKIEEKITFLENKKNPSIEQLEKEVTHMKLNNEDMRDSLLQMLNLIRNISKEKETEIKKEDIITKIEEDIVPEEKIEIKGRCVKCKKDRIIQNPIKKTHGEGVVYYEGACGVCGETIVKVLT